MIEGFLVFIELGEDGTELQVTFAEVTQFEEFARNVEFLGCLYNGVQLEALPLSG